jgi:hypothetical protein
MNLERSCCVGELQPILQPIRDYLPKNYHYFFKEQTDEKFKKKDKIGLPQRPNGYRRSKLNRAATPEILLPKNTRGLPS